MLLLRTVSCGQCACSCNDMPGYPLPGILLLRLLCRSYTQYPAQLFIADELQQCPCQVVLIVGAVEQATGAINALQQRRELSQPGGDGCPAHRQILHHFQRGKVEVVTEQVGSHGNIERCQVCWELSVRQGP